MPEHREFSHEELVTTCEALTVFARGLRKLGFTDEPGDPTFLEKVLIADTLYHYFDWLLPESQREMEIIDRLAEIEIPPDPGVERLNDHTVAEWELMLKEREARLDRLKALPGGCPEVILDKERELVEAARAGVHWMRSRELKEKWK